MNLQSAAPSKFGVQEMADEIVRRAPRMKPWLILNRPWLPGLRFCGYSSDGAGGICLCREVLESEFGREILSEVQRRAPGRVRVGFIGE